MSQKIVELTHERRRFGDRRIGDPICAEVTAINDKRVYRCACWWCPCVEPANA